MQDQDTVITPLLCSIILITDKCAVKNVMHIPTEIEM
jgi:hypothetical protein